MCVDLSGKNHQWNGIHIGRGNTGNGVGDARTGSHQHHTGFAGGARIAVCSMGGALFVTDEDMFYVCLFVEFVVNMQHRTARIAEQVLDPFVFQRADEYFSAAQDFLGFTHSVTRMF